MESGATPLYSEDVERGESGAANLPPESAGNSRWRSFQAPFWEDGYEELGVFENPDDVSGISEVRKATLDLGGLTVKIGLKIGLF